MKTCLKLVVGLALLHGTVAVAAEPASTGELQQTVEQLRASLAAQQARIDQLESKLSDNMQAEMAKVARELAEDAGAKSAGPTWLENLTFFGDLRLRYHNNCFGDDLNKDRNRGRFRLRFGVIKTWLDEQIEVGFRLASGESSVDYDGSDPTAANQTFTDGFSQKRIWIDRAYAKYQPKCVPGLTVIGGKMATPMVHTDLIWDSDVNPEGVWAQYKPTFGPVSPFVNAGYFVLNGSFASPAGVALPSTVRDVVLITYQVGMDWQITKKVKYTVAAGYYDFEHFDVGYNRANGNQLLALTAGGWPYNRLAADYRMFNLVNKVGWDMLGLPWAAYFDWVHNCGQLYSNDAWGDQRDAYAVCLKVGKNQKKGDWSASYKYAYIEANSTPGQINDSNFGFSNRKGHVWRGTYNLTDALTAGASIYWTEAVAGANKDVADVSTILDLIWSF